MEWNNELHLDFTRESKSTRDGVGDALIEIGAEDANIIVLTADLGESTRALEFGKTYPDRFFNVGVAEQNMAGVAAGLALQGKTVFMASFGVFSPGRNWDQVRVSIAYSKANVKILASHTGLSVGEDGATHQALEDIAITRVIPNMQVFSPADYEEAKKIVHATAKTNNPSYIRYNRPALSQFTTFDTPFEIGQVYQYAKGNHITIMTTGITLQFGIEAVLRLRNEGINAALFHVPTIKPLIIDPIIASLEETGIGIVIEDHQIAGGCGSAILEKIAEKGKAYPLHLIGMQDTFGESGKYQELFKKYGISADALYTKAKMLIQ